MSEDILTDVLKNISVRNDEALLGLCKAIITRVDEMQTQISLLHEHILELNLRMLKQAMLLDAVVNPIKNEDAH